MNEFQSLGSAITYLRRYSLSSMLGIVTDKDVDAAGKPLPTLNEERFNKALEKLKQGETTIETISSNFNLTPEQTKQLNEANGTNS